MQSDINSQAVSNLSSSLPIIVGIKYRTGQPYIQLTMVDIANMYNPAAIIVFGGPGNLILPGGYFFRPTLTNVV